MRYKFTLASVTDGTHRELQKPPIGWDEIKRSVLKDRVYFGLFKTITVEMKFIYDGWDYLKDQFARYGVNANIILFVSKDNNHLLKGKVNMGDYKIDLDEKSFKVDIIQSDFIQKFTTRDELTLNILNNKSLDNTFVPAASLIDVTLRSQIIKYYSEFQILFGEAETDLLDPFVAGGQRTFPIEPLANDNPQVLNNSYLEDNSSTTISASLISVLNSFYWNDKTTSQSVDFTVNYSVGFQKVINTATVYIHRYNSSDVLQETILDQDYSANGTYNKALSFTTVFQPGDYLLMFSVSGLNYFWYNSVSLIVNEESLFADTTAKYVLPHELFTNLIAQMTGKQNAFYSEFFGRTDLGYAANGEGAFDARTNGKLLRGFDLTETELSFNPKEIFQNYSKTYCLGLKIINDVVHIEKMEELFNRGSILDIGEVQKLSFAPAKDYLFNSVKVGYTNLEFEEVNGTDEFNGTSNFTNDLVAFKKELDLVSTDVASGLAHELARRKQKSTHGTEDTEWDSKKFQTRLYFDGSTFTNERLENIDYATGILSPDTTYNLYIAPSQNLKRWEKYLGIPVYRSEKKYNYQSKEFNSQLVVGADTPDGIIETQESGDLTINGRYLVPEEATFDATLTRENIISLLADPLQIIQFKFKGVLYQHFIYEIDEENDSHEGAWKTLAINSFARKESPVNYELMNILKHGDGDTDYLKHGDGEFDYILWK